MIKDRETAKYVSEFLLDINGQLNESLEKVGDRGSEDDFKIYRRQVARIINAIFESILEPIYQQHQDLKPPELE